MKFIEHVKQFLIALDQVLNTIFGGWADESLSSRAYRLEQERGRKWARVIIDSLLFFDKDHCKESYESEILRRQLPPAMREKKEV